MLAFFRRALGSPIVLGLLGILLVAFLVTGIGSPSGLSGLTGGPGADNVATVDGKAIPITDVARRAQNQLDQARQQQPDLDMARLLASMGGPGPLVDQYVTGRVIEAWAHRVGLVASDRLVDGEIASIAAFQGPTGRFDEKTMRAVLSQQRVSEAALRDGLRGDLLRRQLLIPVSAGTRPGPGLIEPYAGVLAAKRNGMVGLIPAKPDAVPAPTDADVQGWYKSHLALYSLPERRVLRYAPLEVPPPVPSDAEIAAQYKTDAAQYAASDTRKFSQVVLPDEAAARAFAAKVTGGVAFAKAASDAGFAEKDIALGELSKDALSAITSDAIATAAYSAKEGTTLPPAKSVLGWNIVHVDGVVAKPARTLEQAKPEILVALVKKKQAEAMSALATKVEDKVGDGATFDEVVKANNLKIVSTPALTATGTVPNDPAFKADPVVTALLKAGFNAGADDAPTLERTGQDTGALLDVVRVDPAAPIPLAQVRAKVLQDLVATRASEVANKTAQAILAKVNAGQDIVAAFAAAGLEAPKPITASQLELSQLRDAPPAARALFQIPTGKATLAPAPNGWFVIQVKQIEEAPAIARTAVAQQMRLELGRAQGEEYVEQFAHAIRGDVTVKRNAKAIGDLGRQLTGQAPASGQ